MPKQHANLKAQKNLPAKRISDTNEQKKAAEIKPVLSQKQDKKKLQTQQSMPVPVSQKTNLTQDAITRLGFGMLLLKQDSEYPSLDQIADFPPGPIKLRSLHYKVNETNKTLSGIQLKFTNNVETPLFHAQSEMNSQLQSVEIDVTRTIRRVSMFVSKKANNQQHLCRLKLIDEKDSCIIDLPLSNRFDKEGSWVMKEIPPK